MEIGRFYGGIGALIWSPVTEKYLLLKRSEEKDYASGVWECVTGRVDQGEGFEEALVREIREELNVKVKIDFIIGTSHFYRGEPIPDNELIGVIYCCSLGDSDVIQVSYEHSDYNWVNLQETRELLDAKDPSTRWILRVIERAEEIRNRISPELIQFNRITRFELG
jgi:8-oxo-dGTP diphosphatase